jgi:vacuolar-type H+-ATPase subunit H
MSALSSLLERLRRIQPPPGAAAGAVAVPSAGDQRSSEVAFLFGELDGMERRSELILSSARSAAADIEVAARERRNRLREDASAAAQRAVAELLAQRRATCERQVQEMLADAGREAERVIASGTSRMPALTQEVVERVLEGER